eukprot:COSAG05_NODE_2156_length_3459_cov_6.286310_3_plen_121_part_00
MDQLGNPVVAQLTLKADCLESKENFHKCYRSDVLATMNAQGNHGVHKTWKESGFQWHRCQFVPESPDCAARLERLCDPKALSSRIFLPQATIDSLVKKTPPVGGWQNVKTCASPVGDSVG